MVSSTSALSEKTSGSVGSDGQLTEIANHLINSYQKVIARHIGCAHS